MLEFDLLSNFNSLRRPCPLTWAVSGLATINQALRRSIDASTPTAMGGGRAEELQEQSRPCAGWQAADNGIHLIVNCNRHRGVDAFHIFETSEHRSKTHLCTLGNFFSGWRHTSFSDQLQHGRDNSALTVFATQLTSVGDAVEVIGFHGMGDGGTIEKKSNNILDQQQKEQRK